MLNILAEALLLATRAQPMPPRDHDRNWNPELRLPSSTATGKTTRY